VGVPWLAVALHLPLTVAYQLGMQPFIIFDALKLAIAVIVLPGAWFLAGRGKAQRFETK
jgi:biotin transport system substrate-specific component